MIQALPSTFAQTRDALHHLAVYVISPTQRLATGNEIVLRPTPAGFGTPPFGPDDRAVRVDGSLNDAARLCGIAPGNATRNRECPNSLANPPP